MTGEPLGIWLVRAEAAGLGALLRERVGGEVVVSKATALASQREQFAAAYPTRAAWLFVGATGIAVRFLAGLPRSKHTDPAVVAVDEGGRFAIPLLGGHEGGANALAYRVANAVGAVPAVTTATEAVRPLVLGIGCRRGVSAERIGAAVQRALGERPLDDVREIATVDLKAHEPGLVEFAARHGLPLRVFSHATLAERPWVGRPSEWVQTAVGLSGVCEPCALLASPRGRLAVPKTMHDGVAVAVADDAFGRVTGAVA